MRGQYRYETAPGRWWACVEDADGMRHHMMRDRYEQKLIAPAFWELPVEDSDRKDIGVRFVSQR